MTILRLIARKNQLSEGRNAVLETKKRWLLAAAGAAMASVTGGPALAQSNSAPAPAAEGAVGFEDVIVTARRVEENLQDVPLTIRTFSAEDIEREGLKTVNDLAKITAGLTFDIGGFPNDTRPAVRGMQAERGRPSVAVLLDGQSVSGENISIAGGTAALNANLFDLQRIEVVKGPQSTLYGRNAFAGAINYISAPPSFDLAAKASAEIADGGARQVSGSVTGPLVKDLIAVRVNAYSRDVDGFFTNPVNGGALGAEASQGVGLAVLFTPTDTLDVTLRYQSMSSDNSDNATAFIPSNVRLQAPGARFTPPGPPGTPSVACPASLTGQPANVVTACTRGTFVGEINARENNLQMSLNPLTGKPPFGMHFTQDLGGLFVDWETGFGKLHYDFGYLRNTSDIEQDGDFSNTPAPPGLVLSINVMQQLGYVNQHQEHEAYWTHTIGALDLIAGVEALNEKSTLRNRSLFWLRNPASPLAGPPFLLQTAAVNDIYPVNVIRSTDYLGLYAGFNLSLGDRLEIGGEYRQNKDDIDYSIPGWRRQDVSLSRLRPVCLPGLTQGATFSPTAPATSPPPGTVQACPRAQSLSFEEGTYRVTADYKLTDDVMIYGSMARGYKPGGINTNEVNDLATQVYRPEFVDAWEFGVKSTLLDGRMRLNADVYKNDYTDQQIGVQLSQTTPGGVITTAGIVNAGQVETQGFEMDLDWLVTDNLSLMVGYAHTQAEFVSYIQGPPPGAVAADFVACGVPNGQTSSDQNRAEAGNLCGNFSGKQVGKSPEHSLNVMAMYERELANGNSWFAEISGAYRSERFTDESNLATLPAYSTFDAKLGYSTGPATITLFVTNLTDDDKIKSAQRNVDFGNPEGFAPGRAFIAYLPQPRTVGVRASVKFGD
jgi:outer membrane receptor protein involved in Fe transport